MRISTANAYDASIARLTQHARELSDAQDQISSLKRVNRASDDPSAAARAERATASLQRLEANQRAVDTSLSRMTMAESALGDSIDLLQRARELMMSAGNASYSDSERNALAVELRGIRDQLLAVSNRDDGAGSYLFGGQGSSSPPFVDAPGAVAFRGSQGQTSAADGESMPLALDGASIWLQAAGGNGSFVTQATSVSGDVRIDAGRVVDPSALTGSSYSIVFTSETTYSVLRDGAATAQVDVPYVSGKSIEFDGMTMAVTGSAATGDRFDVVPAERDLNIFTALDAAATALETPGRSSGQIAQANTFALRDINQSMERLSSARSVAGQAMDRLESATGRIGAQTVAQKTVRSQAEDLDMVQALSDFDTRQTGYDAALKAYSMVQKLSLFDYVKF